MTTPQDQQSRELLPCPFCGREAMMSHSRDGEVCNVRCAGWSVGNCLGAGPNCYTEADAAAGWNRRAPVEQAARALPARGVDPMLDTPAGMEPVGYMIDWPDEPELGHYFAEKANDGARSQALHTATQVQAMGRVPPGWQAVPVEPTEEMARAFRADDAPHYFVMTTLRCADFGERYRAALAAAPRPPAAQELVIGPCGQCKDARQPCQCSLDTTLKKRGLVAVNRESFQHMVTKIAAASAPACWCAACDSAASPFGMPTRMSLCPKCGDKRCPRAQHHDSDCFASPIEPTP